MIGFFKITALKWWFDDRIILNRPVYVVGGAVRDHLLQRNPKDIDLVCEDAEHLAKQLAHAHNGKITRLENDFRPVATWRVSCRRADGQLMEIDASPFAGGELTADLTYRDFTLNAVAIEVLAHGCLGSVVDPLGGCRDMESGVIRQASPRAFKNDPLRILRAVRFAAVLNFEIESVTRNAIQNCRRLLTDTAPERISSELLQILGTPRGQARFRWMDELGVLEVIFPEITTMKGCRQNSFHHLDVWEHSLAVMENCECLIHHLEDVFDREAEQARQVLEVGHRIPLLKLAAMLHDMGKPAMRSVDSETGHITFHGHDTQGALQVEVVADRLRLSNSQKTFLKQMAAEHLHVKSLSKPEVKRSTRMCWFRRMMDLSVPSVILGVADIQGTLGPATSSEERERHTQWLVRMLQAYFQDIKPRITRKDLISGKDLIKAGMTPGPGMGKLLRAIQQAQDEGKVTTVEEALALAKSYLNA